MKKKNSIITVNRYRCDRQQRKTYTCTYTDAKNNINIIVYFFVVSNVCSSKNIQIVHVYFEK